MSFLRKLNQVKGLRYGVQSHSNNASHRIYDGHNIQSVFKRYTDTETSVTSTSFTATHLEAIIYPRKPDSIFKVRTNSTVCQITSHTETNVNFALYMSVSGGAYGIVDSDHDMQGMRNYSSPSGDWTQMPLDWQWIVPMTGHDMKVGQKVMFMMYIYVNTGTAELGYQLGHSWMEIEEINGANYTT